MPTALLPWRRRRSRQVNNGQSEEAVIANYQTIANNGPPSPVSPRQSSGSTQHDDQPPSPLISAKSNTAHSKTASTTASHNMLRRYSSMVNDVVEELQCGICLEEYATPRLLQCGHSFCADCLKSIQCGLHIKCPTCRQVTKLQQPSLPNPPVEDGQLVDKQLPINYALTSVLDIVRNNPQKRVLLCTLHQFEDQKFYCLDCDQLLCSECMIVSTEVLLAADQGSNTGINHSGHRVITLKQGALDLFYTLQTRMSESGVALKALDELSHGICEDVRQLDRYAQLAKKRVTEEFAKIFQQLTERQTQLCDEIKADVDRNKALAEQRLSEIQEVRNCIQALQNGTQQLLSSKPLRPLLYATIVSQDTGGTGGGEELAELNIVDERRKCSIASDRMTPAIREAIQALWLQGPEIQRSWNDCQPLSPTDLREALRLQLTFAEFRIDQALFANALQNLAQLGRIETARPEPEAAQQIFVRRSNIAGGPEGGKIIELKLQPWEIRVEDLMRKLELATGVPADSQLLYHQSKVLYAVNRKGEPLELNEYGIESGSTLHLGINQDPTNT